jgi:hypothetical protein
LYLGRNGFRRAGQRLAVVATTVKGYRLSATSRYDVRADVIVPPDVTTALFSRWDTAAIEGTIDIMDTLTIDTENYVESALLDIGSVPLSALAFWHDLTIRAAIVDTVRAAAPVHVCDQSAYNDWTI